MSSPLVSIIIPCYNAAPWLGAAVSSALAQTWPRVEVIVVDDGSTDESVAVAGSFSQRGVKVVSQPNQGASAARNHGLRLAHGEFIQFLDADDLLGPEKIAVQMARLDGAESGFIASCEWSRFHTDPAEARFNPEPVWRDLSGMEFLLSHYEYGWMMQPAAWLCPRPLLDKAGPWDERLTLNDDGEYFCRVVLAARGILFCPGARVYYRSGLSGSLSRRKDAKSIRSLALSTELNCGRILARGSDDPRTRVAVANAWRTLAYESYPQAPRVADEAESRYTALGGSPLPPPGTGRFQMAASLIGWRAAKRLFRLLGRC